MTCYTGYSHTVSFSDNAVFKEELKRLVRDDKSIATCLKINFIDPIANKMCPFKEMVGRYKPSYEVAFIDSPLREAFIASAREKKLYHYHFGYKFYKDGDPDSKYPGQVSDGIIHVRLIVDEVNKAIEHRIIQVCTSHPTPFTVPFERVNF